MLTNKPGTHFTGVIGWPLEYTLSPVLHAAAFRRLSLDWMYLAWPVPPERLGDAVRGLRALGAAGANVTMPHKETVIEHLDGLSGDAREVGAVNTIQLLGERLVGHNTDVDGFRDFLEADAGYDPRGRRALVLGAGGAARAVVKALTDLGTEVTVAARRDDAVRSISDDLGAEPLAWDGAEAAAREADIVVNATPIGMRDNADPVPAAEFRSGQLVADLVYDPPTTPLVARARAAGADAWGGVGMLVHQAAASFRIWTATDPPLEAMSAAAVHAIGSHGRDGRRAFRG